MLRMQIENYEQMLIMDLIIFIWEPHIREALHRIL